MRLALHLGALSVLITTMIAMPNAGAVECSRADEDAAEKSIDHLKSWASLYASYKRFSQCDDGGIAEGYSDAVAKILAHHWAALPKALPLVQADPAFQTWFIGHLNETDDNDDLVKIYRLAKTACPKNADSLCAKIRFQMLSYNCAPEFPGSVWCQAERDLQ